MKCKYCNSEIPNNAMFCKYCGSILDSSSSGRVQAAANNGQVAVPVKKHRLRKFFFFLFVSFIVLNLIAYALLYIFFPPKRYYQTETIYKRDGIETIHTKNHRGFTTGIEQNGNILFEVIFDNDKKISEFTFNDGKEKGTLTIPEYTSYATGTEGNSVSDDSPYRIHLIYNKRDKLTDFHFYDENNNSTVYAQMEYNAFGIMTKAEVCNDSHKQVRKYDYKGDLLTEENYSNGTLVSSFEYEDGVLRKSSIAVTTEKDGKTYVENYTNCSFDENGLITSYKYYNSSNEIIDYYEVESKTDTEVVFVVITAEDNKISERYKYTLNSEGKATCVYQYDIYGNNVGRINYSYDRRENLQSTTQYDGEDNEINSIKHIWKQQPLFLFD